MSKSCGHKNISASSEAGYKHNEMRRKAAKTLELLRALGVVAQLLKLRQTPDTAYPKAKVSLAMSRATALEYPKIIQ